MGHKRFVAWTGAVVLAASGMAVAVKDAAVAAAEPVWEVSAALQQQFEAAGCEVPTEEGATSACYVEDPPKKPLPEAARAELKRMKTRWAQEARTAVAGHPTPTICEDSGFSGEVAVDRFNVCDMAHGTTTFTKIQNGAPIIVGTVTSWSWAFVTGSKLGKDLKAQFTVNPYTSVRDVSGVRVLGTVSCKRCLLPPTVTFAAPVTIGIYVDLPVTVTSVVGVKGEIIYDTEVSWRTSWAKPGHPETNVKVPPTYNLRCDNALPGRGPGCSIQYAPMPSLVFQSSKYPEYVRHVSRARDSGLPTYLTRLTDSTLTGKNTNRACPSSLTRPTGYQCDEYPPKSTNQGAWTASPQGQSKGRTYAGCQIPADKLPTGSVPGARWGACMIPAKQNSDAGTDLGQYNNEYRILDGDGFEVETTP